MDEMSRGATNERTVLEAHINLVVSALELKRSGQTVAGFRGDALYCMCHPFPPLLTACSASWHHLIARSCSLSRLLEAAARNLRVRLPAPAPALVT